jgi:hypothetical protein
MTATRREGPTAHGGAYEVAVFMSMPDWIEVDEKDANTVVITEYEADGSFLYETVGELAQTSTSS